MLQEAKGRSGINFSVHDASEVHCGKIEIVGGVAIITHVKLNARALVTSLSVPSQGRATDLS
jgi:hypothetical protein